MPTETFLSFSSTQFAWLANRDKRLGAFMKSRGPVRRVCHPAPFAALIRTIIGQQISSFAQDKIWNRVQKEGIPLNPEELRNVEEERLRACGISRRKAKFIKNAATKFASGEISEEALGEKSDEDICAELIKLPGVGLWTAEMMLIFTFQRPNVLSYGDLAIRKGLCRLHNVEELPLKKFNQFRELYSPCGSLASIYLWEIASFKGNLPGISINPES